MNSEQLKQISDELFQAWTQLINVDVNLARHIARAHADVESARVQLQFIEQAKVGAA